MRDPLTLPTPPTGSGPIWALPRITLYTLSLKLTAYFIYIIYISAKLK